MDVLSFALYHEAGEQSKDGTNIDANLKEAAEVSDEGEGVSNDPAVIEPSSKRQRTMEVSEQDKLKSRILTELAMNDGYLPIDDICQDNEDRDVIRNTVETLVSEGKLMTEENDEGTLDVFPVSD